MNLRRRLGQLEARQRGTRGPDGRPYWYTPEEWAERERRFDELFAELGELRGEGTGVAWASPGRETRWRRSSG